MLDVEPLFDQVCQSIAEKRQSMDGLRQKADKSTKERDLSVTSQQKMDVFEKDQDQLSTYRETFFSMKHKLHNWQSKSKILERKKNS